MLLFCSCPPVMTATDVKEVSHSENKLHMVGCSFKGHIKGITERRKLFGFGSRRQLDVKSRLSRQSKLWEVFCRRSAGKSPPAGEAHHLRVPRALEGPSSLTSLKPGWPATHCASWRRCRGRRKQKQRCGEVASASLQGTGCGFSRSLLWVCVREVRVGPRTHTHKAPSRSVSPHRHLHPEQLKWVRVEVSLFVRLNIVVQHCFWSELIGNFAAI